MRQRSGRNLGLVVNGFLASNEFAIVHARIRLAARGGGGTVAGTGAAMPVELARWANGLAEPSAQLAEIEDARLPWLDYLGRWLGDPRVRSNFPKIAAAVEARVIGHAEEIGFWRVSGWAMDPADPNRRLEVRIFAERELLGTARADLARADLGGVGGFVPRCGFLFKRPPAPLPAGRSYTIRVVEAESGHLIASRRVGTDPAKSSDDVLRLRAQLDEMQRTLHLLRSRVQGLERVPSYPLDMYGQYADREEDERVGLAAAAFRRLPEPLPVFCFVVPGTATGRDLAVTFGSLREQVSPNWRLLVLDRSEDRVLSDDRMRAVFGADARARRLETTASEAVSQALAELAPDYVWPLEPGTKLSRDAALQAGRAVYETRRAAVYCDHDVLADTVGHLYEQPSLKPDFDFDLLLSNDYVGSAAAFRADLIGALRLSGWADLQGLRQELLLRLGTSGARAEIVHLAMPLVHLPRHVRPDAGPRIALMNRFFEAERIPAVARPHRDPLDGGTLDAARVAWTLPDPAPSVCIVIPTRDGLDLLRDCVDSIDRVRADYPGDQEILIVDNGSREPETLAYFEALAAAGTARTVRHDVPFNWSGINNHAATLTRADVLLFLNNDTVVRTRDWLVELVSLAMRPDVGAVGARLLYEDGSVQHAGVVCAYPRGFIHDSIGVADDGGYADRVKLTRETFAVTGACLASRRAVFEELSGFDDAQFEIAYNDMDYCMRVARAGYRVVYSAFAVLTHLESKTRGLAIGGEKLERDQKEAKRLFAAWDAVMQRDPYYNMNFDRYAPPFERLRPKVP